MLKAKTKITQIGESRYVLIPYEVFNDSVFPLKEGQELEVEIVNKKLVITQ